MLVSVILPTFNEKGNIVRLITEIEKNLRSVNHEVIVVDDNSPDGTAKTCMDYFKKKENIRIFIRKREKGLATAIYFGIKQAKGDLIVVMDTDFNHDPRIIPSMISNAGSKRIVIGSRYVSGGGMENRSRYWFSRFYNFYLRMILGVPVADFLSGFFCIKKDYIKKLHRRIFLGYGDYFIRLIFAIYKDKGEFLEIPVFYPNRSSGQSKSNLTKMFFTYTKTSLKLLLKG